MSLDEEEVGQEMMLLSQLIFKHGMIDLGVSTWT